MANPVQADFTNLANALQALTATLPNTNIAVQNLQNALPNVNNALVANTNAVTKNPEWLIYQFITAEIKTLLLGWKNSLVLVMQTD